MPKLEMKATVAMMTTQMIQLYFLKAMSAELEELEELLLEDGVVEGIMVVVSVKEQLHLDVQE